MSKELIKQIQDMRSSEVIAYITGDRIEITFGGENYTIPKTTGGFL